MPPADQLYAENLALKSEVGGMRAVLSEMHEELARLKAQIDWLKKRLFGPGQGEKLDRAQLLLQLDALEKIAARVNAPVQTVTYERSAPVPGARKGPEDLFAKLPVKETVEIVPEEVKQQPECYEQIGEERTFEVDVTAPQLFKREIIRPKFQRRNDKSLPPVIAPAPARLAPGGYVSAGLMAFVLTSKYVDHLPLYRQEKQLERWGAAISRQTMCEWIALGANWLEAIYRHMFRDLLSGGYVQADETPVRCQDPDVPGKTVQGWLWVLSRPAGDVCFTWRMSRRHEEVATLLKGYQGLLQSDGYEAYASFVAANDGIVHLGCWAHARRYFHDALKEAPARAGFVLRLIGHLYHLEKTWDEAGIVRPVLRAQRRHSEFGLTLQLLKRTAQRLRELSRPTSLLGQACSYLLGHWDVLVKHCEHGRTRIDNNLIENDIRPTALGKKNWMFIGHPEAGDRSAIIYSLVVSCHRHAVNPFAYLKDVLTRLPRMTNQDDLAALTPAHWKPAS
jgi:transposase